MNGRKTGRAMIPSVILMFYKGRDVMWRLIHAGGGRRDLTYASTFSMVIVYTVPIELTRVGFVFISFVLARVVQE